MKLDLTITSTGALTLSRATSQKPPFGALLPAGQDSSLVVPGTRTLGSLFTEITPASPLGIEAHFSGNIYELTASGWLNQGTAENSNAVEVPPGVIIRNPHAYDIGITW